MGTMFLAIGLFKHNYNERAFVINIVTNHFEFVRLRFNRVISTVAYDLNLLVKFDIEKHRLNTTDVRVIAVMTDGTHIALFEDYRDYPFDQRVKRMNARLNAIRKMGVPKI
jgi:hypothetical protein